MRNIKVDGSFVAPHSSRIINECDPSLTTISWNLKRELYRGSCQLQIGVFTYRITGILQVDLPCLVRVKALGLFSRISIHSLNIDTYHRISSTPLRLRASVSAKQRPRHHLHSALSSSQGEKHRSLVYCLTLICFCFAWIFQQSSIEKRWMQVAPRPVSTMCSCPSWSLHYPFRFNDDPSGLSSKNQIDILCLVGWSFSTLLIACHTPITKKNDKNNNNNNSSSSKKKKLEKKRWSNLIGIKSRKEEKGAATLIY